MRHGRGTSNNPSGRFETIHYSWMEEFWDDQDRPSPIKTEFLEDTSQSLITYNKSPDVGFEASINPYRGCEHGCIYCYARPTHEYFGLSAGLDFESKIFVKTNAPELLRKELFSPSWKPQPVMICGVTDAYQPVEKRLELTRQCLQVFLDFRNPVGIVTKNFLVTRDLDLLQRFAEFSGVTVLFSITTLDPILVRKMEPRAVQPERRLEAMARLSKMGIPTGVLIAPVIPGLTDHELPKIINASVQAGAKFARYVILRLPYGVSDLFLRWVRLEFPNREKKIFDRIRDMRGGKLNDSSYGSRMRGHGQFSDTIQKIFTVTCKKYGILDQKPILSSDSFRRHNPRQPELF